MKDQAHMIYADIINLPPPRSKRHTPMSMHDRAAQFSSFAALDTHDEAIREATMQAELNVANRESLLLDEKEI